MPHGAIVKKLVDVSGDAGILYEKGTGLSIDLVAHGRVALVFARGGSEVAFALPRQRVEMRVDASNVLVLPAGTMHRVRVESSLAELLVVLPSAALLESTARAYEAPRAKVAHYFSEPHVLPRTTWINELHHRYYFERLVCQKRDNIATRFLEMELVKESYFVGVEKEDDRNCAPYVFGEDGVVKKAVSFLERRLFEPVTLAAIAKAAATSRSALVRAFRDELGMAPLEYVRARRLEEASQLVRSGRHTHAEVARIVGYENASAFTQAFKRHFGATPSDWARTRQAAPRARKSGT